jgi:hypothetical protein
MLRSRSLKILALAAAVGGSAAPLAHADHRADPAPRYASRDRYPAASDPRFADLRFRQRQLEQQRAQLLRELDFTIDRRQWRRAQQVIGSLARITAQLDRVEAQLPPGQRDASGWRGRRGGDRWE